MSTQWTTGSDSRWRAYRTHLLRLWAQQGRVVCEVGGVHCTTRIEHVDHITPLSQGGTKYDPTNCRPSCATCNTGRRNAPTPQPTPKPTSSW